jgi:hypothetical protein
VLKAVVLLAARQGAAFSVAHSVAHYGLTQSNGKSPPFNEDIRDVQLRTKDMRS